MVLRVMEPVFKPKAWQHTYCGLPHAIGLAKSELLVGKLFYATLDIKEHYGSFSNKKLAEWLPFLEKEWVENVVGGRHTEVKLEKVPQQCPLSEQQLLFLALQGLPPGG